MGVSVIIYRLLWGKKNPFSLWLLRLPQSVLELVQSAVPLHPLPVPVIVFLTHILCTAAVAPDSLTVILYPGASNFTAMYEPLVGTDVPV